jgi:hypothetical protein
MSNHKKISRFERFLKHTGLALIAMAFTSIPVLASDFEMECRLKPDENRSDPRRWTLLFPEGQ